MKRIVVTLCAVLGLVLSTSNCHASWGYMFYSGYQPWWNVFAKRYKCMTPEEERLQKFWHDYYDAMQNFYKGLDRIDWVAYYKNHGYQINGGGMGCGPAGCGRINYAPVFVTPSLQWAVPASMAGGPPVGPPYGGMQGGFPMFPGVGPMGPMQYPVSAPMDLPGGNAPQPVGVNVPGTPTSMLPPPGVSR